MTNFSNARTVGDIIGALIILILMLFLCMFCGFISYAVYEVYQDSRTVKVVKQGDKTYTGFVSSQDGLVTVTSGNRKTILNSANGKIEVETK